MSVGADSMMAIGDIKKLREYQKLERGRVARKKESHNLQIREVIDAIAQTEPELFGEGTAKLMPVEYFDKLDIPICNAHLNNLTLYDEDGHK